ncbi:MAG: phosphoesterase [Caulobacter sp.]|nr:phosphoesterase [Caulobacter sp.]
MLKSGAAAGSPCGSLRVRLGATEAMLRPSGALWVEHVRALVVADLHFEKGSSYAVRGQMLPPYDTRETVGRLEREVEATAPSLLIFLGDSFHDRKAHARLAPQDAARIAALSVGRTLVWVTGNHDADGPGDLPGEVEAEMTLAGLLLRHEPERGPQPGEVSGHLHPCAKIRGTGGRVRRKCFVTDGERLILPAFGAYTGGLNVLDRAFAGMFGMLPMAAALGVGRVHAIDWRSLAPD